MKEFPEHIEYLDLIVKDLNGELSAADQKRLNDWIESSNTNKQLYDEYSKVWREMDKVEYKTSREVDTEWKRLEQFIDKEKALSIQSPRKYSLFFRIAASIIIFFFVGTTFFYIWNQNKYMKVISEVQLEHMELPEGSKVSLNVDSKLIYLKKFTSDTREVELKGEAFFEVARDTIRPFIIRAGDIYIEVLGTSFNVKAYEDEEHVEVTVETGKVAVYQKDKTNNRVILVKGEKAVFNKTQEELQVMENANINYKSWKTKRIIFEDTPMFEVVRIVNEIYQCDLRLAGSNLQDCPVTTIFDNQSLETILNVLESTLNLSIIKEGDSIIISGEGC